MRGKPQKDLSIVLEKTFCGFCHEIKHPLELKALRKCKEQTLQKAKKILDLLQKMKIDESTTHNLGEIVGHYERSSLLQEKIIAQMEHAVRDSSHQFFKKNPEALPRLETHPIIPRQGCSGTYFIKGSIRLIGGIFKPFDEEIGAPNNPKKRGLRGALGERTGGYHTIIGEGIHREVAAYVVDRMVGLHIVPKTGYLALAHPCFYSTVEGRFLQKNKRKMGSFQEFKAGYRHIADLDRLGVEEIPCDLIQRLILLDIIIGNLDRNAGNLLTNGREIVAIDHALSFASKHVNPRSKAWKEWTQAYRPFFPILRDKILHLPIDKLAAKLKKECFIDERCLLRMKERCALLQEGVKAGLTVKEIIQLMVPPYLDKLTDLSVTLQKRAQEIIRKRLSQLPFQQKVQEAFYFPTLSGSTHHQVQANR